MQCNHDGGPDDGGMAYRDRMPAFIPPKSHPCRDAREKAFDGFTAMWCGAGLPHPCCQGVGIGCVKLGDRATRPVPVVTIGKLRRHRGRQAKCLGGLPRTQGRADENSVGARQRACHRCGLRHGICFERFVEREPRLPVGGGGAVADPGEARHHVDSSPGCGDMPPAHEVSLTGSGPQL